MPDTKEGINERLVKILGDKKFVELAGKEAESFNNLADNGSVPNELILTDVAYWIFTINVANCELDPDCNADALREGQTEPAQEEVDRLKQMHNTELVLFDIWDYVLPESHAWSKMYVDYDLYAYLSATSCMYQNCIEDWDQDDNNGLDAIDILNYDTPPEHANRDSWMYFYGSSCDTYSGSEPVINSVETTPYLANTLQTQYTEDDLSINSCAYAYKHIQATHDWILGIKVESDGSYYWVN